MVVSLKHFNYYKQNAFVSEPNMNLCSQALRERKAQGSHLSGFDSPNIYF